MLYHMPIVAVTDFLFGHKSHGVEEGDVYGIKENKYF
jgi:hypothetical protein